MSRVLSVNENRDIHTVGGRLQVATGLTAVLQNCEQAARAQFAEMIYAADRGVNYLGSVFNNSPNTVQFEAGLRQQLIRVRNVTAIESLEARIVGDEVRYTARIRTTFGTGTITNNSTGGANG